MFQVVRVDSRQAEAVEPLGTKRKFWFSDGRRRVLFKAEERGSGDDWAEKVACELCGLLGLPHVRYELAEQYDGPAYVRPGVVCETCAPKPLSLVLGNELLLKRDPAYPAEDKRRHKVSEHTVHAVVEVIGALSPPTDLWMAGVPLGIQTALDVFVGYVMLDAWIANQDRHHENWAALRDGERMRLAPTFDHGAALARNLTDEERKERLTTKDRNHTVSHFVRRASSAFYARAEDTKSLRTLEAFVAFARAAPNAAHAWLKSLEAVSIEAMQRVLAEVPKDRLSPTASEFTLELLILNQQRLNEEPLK